VKTPLPFRSNAPAVILWGFAGGEFLPLPGSKGRAFPFLLTLDGSPTAHASRLWTTGVHRNLRKLRKKWERFLLS